MTINSTAPRAALIVALIVSLSMTCGCFDIHTARGIFYPPEDDSIEFEMMTIAKVEYDFKGPIDSFGRIQVGAAEFHREIDNFFVAYGGGGGNIYLVVQVHFFHSTGASSSFPRYLNVSLIHLPDGGDPEVMVYRSYDSNNEIEVDILETVGNVIEPSEGIYSLRVEGIGTSVTSGGTTFYDWFKVSANGQLSTGSYNNDRPGEA